MNFTNLKRIISVNHIKKYNVDTNNDFLGISDIHSFKQGHRDNEARVIQTLHILGPPKYVKTKFRTKTVNYYNIFSGMYFGRAKRDTMINKEN